MGSLGWAGSWLVVLAVGLAPILLYWAGSIIRRSVRRKWLSRRFGPEGGEGERAKVTKMRPAG